MPIDQKAYLRDYALGLRQTEGFARTTPKGSAATPRNKLPLKQSLVCAEFVTTICDGDAVSRPNRTGGLSIAAAVVFWPGAQRRSVRARPRRRLGFRRIGRSPWR